MCYVSPCSATSFVQFNHRVIEVLLFEDADLCDPAVGVGANDHQMSGDPGGLCT